MICGLRGTPYDRDECPTCRAEREEAKGVIERRLREDRQEKDKLIRDVKEWLEARLYRITKRSLGGVLDAPAELKFVVLGRPL